MLNFVYVVESGDRDSASIDGVFGNVYVALAKVLGSMQGDWSRAQLDEADCSIEWIRAATNTERELLIRISAHEVN